MFKKTLTCNIAQGSEQALMLFALPQASDFNGNKVKIVNAVVTLPVNMSNASLVNVFDIEDGFLPHNCTTCILYECVSLIQGNQTVALNVTEAMNKAMEKGQTTFNLKFSALDDVVMTLPSSSTLTFDFLPDDIMAENNAFQEFGGSDSGTGRVNLATGEMEFVHKDLNSSGNIFPISVAHVYSPLQKDWSCGKGWKLNLQQKLEKWSPSDYDDTFFTYVDGSGNRHIFCERYYYKKDDGKKVYKTRGEIDIGFDGKLTYVENGKTHEVKRDFKSSSGLTLQADVKGFKGWEKIETRHDEIANLEEELKSIKRNLVDLKRARDGFVWADDEGQKQENGVGSYLFGSDMELTQFQSLKIEIASLAKEQTYNVSKESIIRKNAELNALMKKQYSDATMLGLKSKYYDVSKWLEDVDIIAIQDVSGKDLTGLGGTVLGRDIKPQRQKLYDLASQMRLRGEAFEKETAPIQQSIRDLSLGLESSSFTDQMALMVSKKALMDCQVAYLKAQSALQSSVNTLALSRVKEDVKTYEKLCANKEFQHSQLLRQIPQSVVTDQNGIKMCFNAKGNLCALFDSNENAVSLLYRDNGELDCLLDGEGNATKFGYKNGLLERIEDSQGHETRFEHSANGLLEKVIYPSGESSTYKYTHAFGAERFLTETVDSSGLGVQIEYAGTKVTKLTEVTYATIFDSKTNFAFGEVSKGTFTKIIYESDRKTTLEDKDGVFKELVFDNIGRAVTTKDLRAGGGTLVNEYVSNRCGFSIAKKNTEENLFGTGFAETVVLDKSSTEQNAQLLKEFNSDELPSDVTDLILSASAEADSAYILDRRQSAFCKHWYGVSDNDLSDHAEHYDDSTALDYYLMSSEMQRNRKFEIRAEAVYGNMTKLFIASFDSFNPNKQSAAIPVTFDEDEAGRPIKPDKLKIFVDYSYNMSEAVFSDFELSKGQWTYNEFDEEGDQIFAESNCLVMNVGNDLHTRKVFANNIFDNDRRLVKQIVTQRDVQSDKMTEKTFETKFVYDSKDRLVKTIDRDGVVNETVYNKKGKAAKTYVYHKDDPTAKLVSEKVYAENGQLAAEKNERGDISTEYTYVDGTNIVSNVTNANGQNMSFGRDCCTDELKSISSTCDGQSNTNKWGRTKNMLTSLCSEGVDYAFRYDKWGRTTGIDICGVNHSEMDYTDDQHTSMTNANGETFARTTDKNGNVTLVQHTANGTTTPFVTNTFDIEQRLTSTTDGLTNMTTTFVYDEHDNVTTNSSSKLKVVTKHGLDGVTEVTHFDGSNNQICKAVNVFENGKVVGVQNGGYSQNWLYDKLGRLTQVTDKVGSLDIDRKVNFVQCGDHATNLVFSDEVAVNGKTKRTRFCYDKVGNITQILENERVVVRYTYDKLNRLVREDNKKLNKTTGTYYGDNGNIISQIATAYSQNEVLIDGERVEYSYDKANRMVGFSGQSCAYDALGNPTTYRGKSCTWKHGRNLATYGDMTFAYNASGARVSKSSTAGSSSYLLDGNKIVQETKTIGNVAKTLTYIYGSDGVKGFTENGVTYLFQKNMQGDITEIFDQKGVLVGSYVYDAWGNHKVYGVDGQTNVSPNFIGNINPMRYRGYYFDTETNLYYLQSRYYDSETGRFINADDITFLDHETIGGLNLFAYCGNNPVMRTDPNGTAWWHWALGVLAVVGMVVLSVATLGAATAIAAAVSGAIVGGVYGGMTAAATGQNILVGVLAGAIGGAVMSMGAALAGAFIAPVFAGTATIGGLSTGAALAAGAGIAFGTGVVGGMLGDILIQSNNGDGKVDWAAAVYTGLQWAVLNTFNAFTAGLAGPLTGFSATLSLGLCFGFMYGSIGLLIDLLRANESKNKSRTQPTAVARQWYAVA